MLTFGPRERERVELPMSTSSPISPRLVKGGIVIMDPTTSTVKTVIALQYNSDSLARTLQIQSMPGGTRSIRQDAGSH